MARPRHAVLLVMAAAVFAALFVGGRRRAPAPAPSPEAAGIGQESMRLYLGWSSLEEKLLAALETPGADAPALEAEAAELAGGTHAMRSRLTEQSPWRAYAAALDGAAQQLLVLARGLRARSASPGSYPDARLLADLEDYKVRKVTLQRESYKLRGGRE